ncbi:MAG TPA: alpha-amylase family glycosyl hydrolase [bacterium]|nr:alpha-amylase family glycosyl hydrolase [bacterium]
MKNRAFPGLLLTLSRFEPATAPARPDGNLRHFHVSRASRERYRFEENLYTLSGNVVFPDYQAVRRFAHAMNEKKDLKNHPEQAVKAGHLNAMALIDEVLHHVVRTYRKQVLPTLLTEALDFLRGRFGEETDAAIRRFAEEFPPLPVHRGEMTIDDYLAGKCGDDAAMEVELEELLMLFIANQNPAFTRYHELYGDKELRANTRYGEMTAALGEFFETKPKFGPGNKNLLDLLMAPALSHPDSLADQLGFIRERWGLRFVGEHFMKILVGGDMLREEEKMLFPVEGRGEVMTAESLGGGFHRSEWRDNEYEAFSPDRDWMPRLVMIAKNAFVWLDQLSKQYGKHLTRLDDIPEDELKKLAAWGFTGLWLIGIWERSTASRTIKQIMGNPEAAASAYSLYDYTIAQELGGEAALATLRDRAKKYGVRLASDMVPNHMAIDSRWVHHHPDWFVQTSYPPFPSYTYNGPNLSTEPHLGIYIEDRYYDRTDAAVTFKRVDFRHNDVRYIYHGNDGTSYPWNDTAQLDYTKPEVREAVIQTILHVARQFPVIRFDAAMTLAKRHYQRLWFPEPGTGGDIPSRAEHALSRDQFNEKIPNEFWREVVDRIQAEIPDTLLLAEAFWLMEGYFVRTLGMHRVYNSAFMNFLKNEENDKYRLSVRNVLEFDPYILQRFVNFMNNPDEKTTVEQFGKDDKCFGVSVLLATMPGLPMFGHGQIEGFTEKYGMEYHKAYWNESVDHHLVQRHEREVFPLLRKRWLFAGVDNFYLYDFFLHNGQVDENVYAYSNRSNGEKALVIFNNKFRETAGWIKTSVGFLDKGSGQIRQRTLVEGLELTPGAGRYLLMRDHITGLEFIRRTSDLAEKGLYAAIGAYKYQVFLDLREVVETAAEPWGALHDALKGAGVPDITRALTMLTLDPLHGSFRRIANPATFKELIAARTERVKDKKKSELLMRKLLARLAADYTLFLEELRRYHGGDGDAEKLALLFADDLAAFIELPAVDLTPLDPAAQEWLTAVISDDIHALLMMFGWTLTARLSQIVREKNDGPASNAILRQYLLEELFLRLFREMGRSERHAEMEQRHIRAFVYYQNWWRQYPEEDLCHAMMSDIFADENMHRILQMNEYKGVRYFNKEATEHFVNGLFVMAVLDLIRSGLPKAEMRKELKRRTALARRILDAMPLSEYRVDKLLEILKNPLSNSVGARQRHARISPSPSGSGRPDGNAPTKTKKKAPVKKPTKKK